VNVTGGIKVAEPAIDLAVAASILSSLKVIITGRDTGFFGEIGLTGEVRKTVNMDLRLRSARDWA
jgi:DNA repair protein RadA/Sms